MNKELVEHILFERINPSEKNRFVLKDICFKEQYDFIMDQSPWSIADCSRRAGKSIGCAVDLTKTCLDTANINCLYVTLTRGTAKRLVWKELLKLNDTYFLNGKVNISELTITYPNGSMIYLSGCNNQGEIEKFRGMAFKLVYIDEVQSFKAFLKDLIDDVIGPALIDYAGSLKLIGTPAPLKRGFFWEALNNPEYSRHKWTFWNNPHIALKSKKTHKEILERELKRRGVTIDDPSIRREWFGEWIDDTNALVCLYNGIRNHFTDLPPIMTEFVIGIDLGYNDADAIAVIGWNVSEKKSYLVEELVRPKQGITELMTQITALNDKYKPLRIVMDEGGLGKKIGEELRKRYSLPIQAAEKSRKQEYIALMNDAFLTSSLFVKNSSHFAKDTQIIEWDFDKSTADKKVIKKDPHSDIFDAVLYAYRECLHWLSEPIKPKEDPVKNWAKIAEAELYARMEAEEARKEWEDKQHDQEQIMDNYDPFKSDNENAITYYINKKQQGK